MIVKKLIIQKLYGYLSKTIEFNDGINLLVGINGSGKTSILNIVNWILTPSMANLATTEFESLELLISFKKELYSIKVVQESKTLSYWVYNLTTSTEYNRLKVNLHSPPKFLNESQKGKIFGTYEGLGPDEEELETWRFVFSELPEPIVIGLDRYLYVEDNKEFKILDDGKLQKVPKDSVSNDSPLKGILKLANREHNIYKTKTVDLNQNLINKIMLSAFDEINNDSLDLLEKIPQITIEQVDNLHKRVEAFFKENMHGNSQYKSNKSHEITFNKIEGYFNNLKNVIAKTKEHRGSPRIDILHIMNISQFKKLNEFIQEFESFDKKNQEAYSNISIYLETINRFLIDSSKILTFRETISELVFDVVDKNGKVISKNRDISTLSSGEKQILILLTYLKFNNKNDTVFIIDEPEISLHPKWQEEFLDAVKALTSKNTQVIIATHSPIIVGNNQELCKVLLPYNN